MADKEITEGNQEKRNICKNVRVGLTLEQIEQGRGSSQSLCSAFKSSDFFLTPPFPL